MKRDESDIMEFSDNGCTLRYDRERQLIHADGKQKTARRIILRLQKDGWISKKLKTVWFSGHPIALFTGYNLGLFLSGAGFDSLQPAAAPPPSFRDLLNPATQ